MSQIIKFQFLLPYYFYSKSFRAKDKSASPVTIDIIIFSASTIVAASDTDNLLCLSIGSSDSLNN